MGKEERIDGAGSHLINQSSITLALHDKPMNY